MKLRCSSSLNRQLYNNVSLFHRSSYYYLYFLQHLFASYLHSFNLTFIFTGHIVIYILCVFILNIITLYISEKIFLG